jgi:imidazolonepropionase-like amidohydrolase
MPTAAAPRGRPRRSGVATARVAHPEHVGAEGAHAHQHGLQSALEVQQTAVGLVRAGFAFCLASDGHPGSREHTLQLGFHLLLRAGASSAQAFRLTQANPSLLLRQGVPALAGREPSAAF